jgi:TolB-like protein
VLGTRGLPAASLTILPFVSESRDRELDYVGEGPGESLITGLSRVPGLKP